MKKVILFSVLVLLTSCKKEYACDCIYTETKVVDDVGIVDLLATQESNYYDKFRKQEDAGWWCKSYESRTAEISYFDENSPGNGFIYETKCDLK